MRNSALIIFEVGRGSAYRFWILGLQARALCVLALAYRLERASEPKAHGLPFCGLERERDASAI